MPETRIGETSPHDRLMPAAFAILAAQVSINFGAALGKGLFPVIGPEGVAALRTGIAAVILVIAVRPWSIAYSRGQIGWLALYGLTLGSMNLLIYSAIERIPLGIAVAIEICGPIAVVLFTSRTMRDVVWLVLTVAGLLLLVPWPNDAAALDLTGIAFALAAAACWALYILFGKRASATPSGAAVALGMCFACLVTFPAGIASAGPHLLEANMVATGLAVAILSSALPYFLEMKALERLSSRVFGVVTSSAPAIAALVGFLFLGEHLSAYQWLAVAAMMTASAGCSLTARPAVAGLRDDIVT